MADPRLHLLHLASPALPVGAYAYSQGLEYAIEAGWLEGDALQTWLEDGLRFGLGKLDLPVLRHAWQAITDKQLEQLDLCNDLLLANRETRELLLEDQQIGGALWRLLRNLEGEPLPSIHQMPGYATAYAVAAARWQVSVEDACRGYAYSWLENQVTAATKLVPLGQSHAQALLLELLPAVSEACDDSQGIALDAIGLSLPGLAMASSRHERQHTRLFRS